VRAAAPASIKTKTFRSRREVLASIGPAKRSGAAVGPRAALSSTSIRRPAVRYTNRFAMKMPAMKKNAIQFCVFVLMD